MKKRLAVLITLIVTLLLSIIGLTACGGGEEVKAKVNFIVDGETYETIETSGNEILSMPEDPVKEGYEFDGWYWDKTTLTQPFTANSLSDEGLKSDIKVYAKWSVKQYTLTIVYDNGAQNKVITQDFGSTIESIANPSKVGCVFNGWSEDIPETMPAENKTIYAIWSENQEIFVLTGNEITGLTEYGITLSKIVVPEVVNGVTITSIGVSAFSSCYQLTSIEIGDSVVSIGLGAFASCTSLTSVTIGNGVKTIGAGAFRECKKLTNIKLGSGVTRIGETAFYKCYSLAKIVIPNSVTSIGTEAFRYCYRLVEVINKSPSITVSKYSSSNGYLGYYALEVFNSTDTYVNKFTNDNGYIVYNNGSEKLLCAYQGTEKDLTLPSYITAINNYALYWCSSLTSVVIPDSVTSIGMWALSDCWSLTSIEFLDTSTWYRVGNESDWQNKTGGTETDLSAPTTNDDKFVTTYFDFYWYKI